MIAEASNVARLQRGEIPLAFRIADERDEVFNGSFKVVSMLFISEVKHDDRTCKCEGRLRFRKRPS
jgi:hypothetical protein